MTQEEYWNEVSETKEFTTPFQMREFAEHVKRSGTILDVGCGYGRTLNELYQAGFEHLIGIDFSEGMIRRGRSQFPHLDLRVEQSGEIPLPGESVDAVILFAVLTCIEKNEDQQRLIGEIYRVLKPGGILYVNDFLLNTDERNVKRYRAYQENGRAGTFGVFELPGGGVCRHHEESWLRRLLGDFNEISGGHPVFRTMNRHVSNGFYFIGRK